MLLEATALSKSFGENLLFSDVTFKIEDNDKIGLVGQNGSGKTTLFKLLCREEEPDGGQVITKRGLTIGQLKQHACENSGLSTYGEALSVFGELQKIEDQLEEVNLRLESSSDLALIEKQQALQELYERKGGLVYKAHTKSALIGLGFTEQELTLPVQSLSGGQKSKVELCKLLLSSPDLMLLDEPTNHLDIDAIEWLDGYISSYKGAVVIISHDRYFLDKVANKIFDLSYNRLTSYNGNYTKFLKLKEERAETIRRNYENTMEEVERINQMIALQKTFSMERNYKIIDTKQKQIDRLLDGLIKPEAELDEIRLSFKAKLRTGDEVLNAKDLTVAFDQKALYKNVSINLRRGEKVFLIGPNGCGKTTLLKQLMKDKDNCRFGTGVSVGYFDQHGASLDLNKTPFEQLRFDYPNMTDTEIRNALAAVLFKGDDVFKKMSDLSGGERARVDLIRLSLKCDTLLFLDEPTNHLDLSSRERLEQALINYDGTMLVVSHDRFFINRLATTILRFKNEKLERIEGNYDRYLEIKQLEIENTEKAVNTEKVGRGKEQYLQKKERESNLRKLKTRLKTLEEQLAQLEAELKLTEEKLQSEEIASDYEKVTELSSLAATLNEKIEEQFMLWEELSSELEKLNG